MLLVLTTNDSAVYAVEYIFMYQKNTGLII